MVPIPACYSGATLSEKGDLCEEAVLLELRVIREVWNNASAYINGGIVQYDVGWRRTGDRLVAPQTLSERRADSLHQMLINVFSLLVTVSSHQPLLLCWFCTASNGCR